jgi:hypothetical protein
MHLKVGTINGRKYLSIAHGYRDAKTGKSRTKTIKPLGYLDVLEKEHADPVAYFKKIVEEMKRQEIENNAPSKISIDRNEVITADQDNRKNLGYSVLSKMYYELGLDIFFNNHSRGLKMEYNVNSIMKLLLFSRIQAHFLICFVALVIVRILERCLGGSYSVSKIIESLCSVSCSRLEENWYVFDYADEITEAIRERLGIDLSRRYLRLGEIRKILGATKKV